MKCFKKRDFNTIFKPIVLGAEKELLDKPDIWIYLQVEQFSILKLMFTFDYYFSFVFSETCCDPYKLIKMNKKNYEKRSHPIGS